MIYRVYTATNNRISICKSQVSHFAIQVRVYLWRTDECSTKYTMPFDIIHSHWKRIFWTQKPIKPQTNKTGIMFLELIDIMRRQGDMVIIFDCKRVLLSLLSSILAQNSFVLWAKCSNASVYLYAYRFGNWIIDEVKVLETQF